MNADVRLDDVSGKLYRDKILAPGASRDELDSLKVCTYPDKCLDSNSPLTRIAET
jgi:hypothetical protein